MDEKTTDTAKNEPEKRKFSRELSLEDIRRLQDEFCLERGWGEYSTPRNLLLALVGDVGQLASIFQWHGEAGVGLPDLTEAEKKNVGEEISAALIYLVRMADKCNIDLPDAVLQKIEQNKKKFPVN